MELSRYILLALTLFSYTSAECNLATWKKFSNFSVVHDKPVYGGEDYLGTILHICRARIDGALIPGKAQLADRKCHVGYNNREETIYDNFEVLVNPSNGFLVWRKYLGFPPENVIVGGYQDAQLYIGRCFIKGKFRNNSTYESDSPGVIRHTKSGVFSVAVSFGGIILKCGVNMKILVCEITHNQEGKPDILVRRPETGSSGVDLVSVWSLVIIVSVTFLATILAILLSLLLYRKYFVADERSRSFRWRRDPEDPMPSVPAAYYIEPSEETTYETIRESYADGLSPPKGSEAVDQGQYIEVRGSTRYASYKE